MKLSLLTLVFAVGSALPGAYAQAQTNSTTEHHEEKSSAQVNPDGTAVQNKSATHESTNSSNNADGSSNTSQSRRTSRKTEVKPASPATGDSTTTTEKHSSSTSTTDTKVQQ